jgi:acyl-CoA reductase-like NAD-dependent aldehyde dehydrogenase
VVLKEDTRQKVVRQHKPLVVVAAITPWNKKVRANAAGTLKRLTLELGGNDVAIVLGDIDPKEVTPKIYAAAMANAGQFTQTTIINVAK